jgi:hypothetical protein
MGGKRQAVSIESIAVDCQTQDEEADEGRQGICPNENRYLGKAAVMRIDDRERREPGRGNRQGHCKGEQAGRVVASEAAAAADGERQTTIGRGVSDGRDQQGSGIGHDRWGALADKRVQGHEGQSAGGADRPKADQLAE